MTAVRDPNDASSDRHAHGVQAAQVDLLYRQLRPILIATVGVGALFAAALWPMFDADELLVWLIGLTVLSVARYRLLCQYRHAKAGAYDPQRWKQRFLLGIALNGTLWGAAGLQFFLPHSPIHLTLLALVLGGMSAGSVTTLSPVRGAAWLYVLPAVLPFAARMITVDGPIHLALGGMSILFIGLMWIIARRLYETVEESLRLGFENLELVNDLRRAHAEQALAHRALATEVEEKHAAQRDLQRSHEQLEQRVAERTSELAQLTDRLAMEKELFRITLASIGDGVITTDRAGRITYLNPAAEAFTGWSSGEVQGRPLATVFKITPNAIDPDGHANNRHPPIAPSADGHVILADRLGNPRDVHHSAAPIVDRSGAPLGTVLTFRDTSEERELARQLSHQATHDALTGLVNRHEFERRLERVLRTLDPHEPHALIFIDLDQFKVVNDTCGHVAGDELLRQIAVLMRNHIRACDTIARLGGDEFGVLLEHCPMNEAVRIAQTLRELAQDFRFGYQNHSFVVGMSLGLVEITSVWESAASLLRAADSACYMAKDRGRNRVYIYKPDDHIVARRFGEMQWMPRIKKALAEGRMKLYRQAIVPTRRDAAAPPFAEVLVRLLDEQGGTALPGAFLPAAERYGQIAAIDRWVIGESIAVLQRCRTEDPALTLSINISGQSFSDPDLLDYIVATLKASGVAPRNLCFEITETAAISDFTSALPFISNLRDLGCRFALDDFGSGLSSFGYLKTLPVDFLKIDGRFIKELAANRVDEAMVEAIHRLGDVMGLKTIAEWVEDAATLDKLTAMRVDFVQGNYVAPPEPL